ncbi:vomeronasal type-1 receptor 2-like [Lepus europaeus]|uniref:vomeronasal type-1 receptor 2-like n=1 Tax=Lepus europaeus TaxID=9983 RepID=UPI002B47C2BD|nr:vomeronasal type-1 receptor 2-like [Lepus europaeus]
MSLNIGIIFLAQVVIGSLGNFSLLSHYFFLYMSGHRSRSTDLIIRHLTVANALVILSRGIPETMTAFGLKHFLNDAGCKLVFYVHRVSRGASIGNTCLLSVFQAITISPRNSRWAELKVKAIRYTGPSSVFCWILYMLINTVVPMFVTEKRSEENSTATIDFGYCSSNHHDRSRDLLPSMIISTPDVLCLGLMMWASGAMVFLLYRHKHQVRHIHRNNISRRSSPETRATHSILVLVSTFVSFNALSSIIYLYFSFFAKTTWWLVNTSALINACFPSISPFILLSRDPDICKFFPMCLGRHVQFPHLIRKL